MATARRSVSIIIPCFNAAVTLERCLKSCFQQTYPRCDIIVVDNNSNDKTVCVAEQTLTAAGYASFTLTHCETQGVVHARNHGMSLASGDYIQWLDADDALDRHKIERQIEFLETSPQYHIAYGDWRWNMAVDPEHAAAQVATLRHGVPAIAYGPRDWELVAGSQSTAINRYRLEQWDDYLLRLLEDKWIPPHSYLLRREAADTLQKLCGWHPQAAIANDREYFTLAALLGFRFGHVIGAMVDYHTWSAHQLTRSASVPNRARQVKHIFARLRRRAREKNKVTLSETHQYLLGLDPNLWRGSAKNGRVARDKDGFFLRRSSNRREPLSDLEAVCVHVVERYDTRLTLEDYAKLISNHVPKLWEQHVTILSALAGLARRRLLKREKVV